MTACANHVHPPHAVKTDHVEELRDILAKHHRALSEKRLLKVPFVTVTEYLWYLRMCAQESSVLGDRAMFYLAAAVSDFYIPAEEMVCSERNGEVSVFAHMRVVSIMRDRHLRPCANMLRSCCAGAIVSTSGLSRCTFLFSPCYRRCTRSSLATAPSCSKCSRYGVLSMPIFVPSA